LYWSACSGDVSPSICSAYALYCGLWIPNVLFFFSAQSYRYKVCSIIMKVTNFQINYGFQQNLKCLVLHSKERIEAVSVGTDCSTCCSMWYLKPTTFISSRIMLFL
jgi:hypothetical protein